MFSLENLHKDSNHIVIKANMLSLIRYQVNILVSWASSCTLPCCNMRIHMYEDKLALD